MPKFDLILKPGEPIPGEFAAILHKRLSPAIREKLLKHGGLIRLSVATPYVDRKAARKATVIVDDQFIRELEASVQHGDAIRAHLERLAVKQLLEVCTRLQLPVRSKASSREIREAIVRSIQSGHIWDRIAGTAPSASDAPAPDGGQK